MYNNNSTKNYAGGCTAVFSLPKKVFLINLPNIFYFTINK